MLSRFRGRVAWSRSPAFPRLQRPSATRKGSAGTAGKRQKQGRKEGADDGDEDFGPLIYDMEEVEGWGLDWDEEDGWDEERQSEEELIADVPVVRRAEGDREGPR